jgi:hypothetical protein
MDVTLVEGFNELTFRVEDDTATETTLTVAYVPEVVDAFKTFTKKGRGSKIVRFRIPEDAIAIAQITGKGTSNFAVWTVAADGSMNDLLVNEIGRYKGTRLFDARDGQHSVAFKVEANGPWSITVKPVTKARVWNPARVAEGSGDMVLRLVPPTSGFQTARFVHRGGSNFAVWAWAPDTVDLLVNEIGRYRGENLFPDGTVLVEIIASGGWRIVPQ